MLADKNRVLVEGVMMMKKHVKPNPQQNIKGGIAEQEATIHLSNVMLLDADGNKTRVGSRVDGGQDRSPWRPFPRSSVGFDRYWPLCRNVPAARIPEKRQEEAL